MCSHYQQAAHRCLNSDIMGFKAQTGTIVACSPLHGMIGFGQVEAGESLSSLCYKLPNICSDNILPSHLKPAAPRPHLWSQWELLWHEWAAWFQNASLPQIAVSESIWEDVRRMA